MSQSSRSAATGKKSGGTFTTFMRRTVFQDPTLPRAPTESKPSIRRAVETGFLEGTVLKDHNAKVKIEYEPHRNPHPVATVVLSCPDPRNPKGPDVEVDVTIDDFFSLIQKVKLDEDEVQVEDKDLPAGQDALIHLAKAHGIQSEHLRKDGKAIKAAVKLQEADRLCMNFREHFDSLKEKSTSIMFEDVYKLVRNQLDNYLEWQIAIFKNAADARMVPAKEADLKPDGWIGWFQDFVKKLPENLEGTKSLEEMLWPNKASAKHLTMTVEEVTKHYLPWCSELKATILDPAFLRHLKPEMPPDKVLALRDMEEDFLRRAVPIPAPLGHECVVPSPSEKTGPIGLIKMMANILGNINQGKHVPELGMFEAANWLLPIADIFSKMKEIDARSSRDLIRQVAQEASRFHLLNLRLKKAAFEEDTPFSRKSGRLVQDTSGVKPVHKLWDEAKIEYQMKALEVPITSALVLEKAASRFGDPPELSAEERNKVFGRAKTPMTVSKEALKTRIDALGPRLSKWFDQHLDWTNKPAAKVGKLVKKLESSVCRREEALRLYVLRNHARYIHGPDEDDEEDLPAW